jgi:hypothetical protein
VGLKLRETRNSRSYDSLSSLKLPQYTVYSASYTFSEDANPYLGLGQALITVKNNVTLNSQGATYECYPWTQVLVGEDIALGWLSQQNN